MKKTMSLASSYSKQKLQDSQTGLQLAMTSVVGQSTEVLKQRAPKSFRAVRDCFREEPTSANPSSQFQVPLVLSSLCDRSLLSLTGSPGKKGLGILTLVSL